MERNQFFGFRICQRFQQHTVDDTEHCCVRADSKRESEHGDGGKAGVTKKLAHAVTNVCEESIHEILPSVRTDFLFRAGQAAHLDLRGAARFFWSKSACGEF